MSGALPVTFKGQIPRLLVIVLKIVRSHTHGGNVYVSLSNTSIPSESAPYALTYPSVNLCTKQAAETHPPDAFLLLLLPKEVQSGGKARLWTTQHTIRKVKEYSVRYGGDNSPLVSTFCLH